MSAQVWKFTYVCKPELNDRFCVHKIPAHARLLYRYVDVR